MSLSTLLFHNNRSAISLYHYSLCPKLPNYLPLYGAKEVEGLVSQKFYFLHVQNICMLET